MSPPSTVPSEEDLAIPLIARKWTAHGLSSKRADCFAGFANARTVLGIRAVAVGDVSFNGFPPSAVDCSCGVVEEQLLLLAGHEAEQIAWLLEVVVVVLAEVEPVSRIPDGVRRFGVRRLLCPPAEVARFDAGCSALVAVDADCAVPMI